MEVGSALFPVDEKGTAALADRHDFDGIDVDMWRHAAHPVDDFGDISGRQRLGSLVDLVCPLFITMKSDNGKFTFGKSRLNIGDPDFCFDQIGEQVIGKLLDKSLGPAINVATGIGVITGN